MMMNRPLCDFAWRRVLLGLAGVAALLGPTAAAAQELPRVVLETSYAPPSGTLRSVPSNGDFQAALNAAQPGDIIELQAGATYVGNFTLPAKSGTEWIYIRTSAHASLPNPGTRVFPSHANLLAKLVTATGTAVIRTASAAHHYRFVGIEITSTFYPIVNLVHLEAPSQDQLAEVPTDIVFDRSYIHGGTAAQTLRRGILMNSARTAVVDSYISDAHEVNGETQAIAIINGPGPFKLVNNFLSGAGINVLFGGGDPAISGLAPSDVEIRGNYFFKPLSWMEGHPTYAGFKYTVKNSFELKNARRVLVEGNIFENNWSAGQAGMAVVMTPRNQSGGCPWCGVEDITFRKNIIRNTPGGIQVAGTDDGDGRGMPYYSIQTKRILIQDNVLDQIGAPLAGDRRGFYLQNIASPNSAINGGIAGITVEHNTLRDPTAAIYLGDSQSPQNRHENVAIRNNILDRTHYGVFGSAGEGTPAFNTYTVYTPGTLTRTVLIGAQGSLYPAQTCSPGGTTCYPATVDNVGFVDWQAGDYRLCGSNTPPCSGPSPYKNAGTDGKDLGADIAAVNAATAGVISGAPPSSQTQAPYTGTPFAVPGEFAAENFDHGGEGVAYHDVVGGNAGGQYRTQEDVDIIVGGTGFVVNNIQSGEWLEYTISVATTGSYAIELRASSEYSISRFHVEIDGTDVSGPVTVPDTGSWGTFQYIPTNAVTLSAGQHVLRVHAEQEYFNLDAIRIAAAGTILLSDTFDGSGAPSSAWTIGTFSGFTQSPDIPVTQTGGVLQIGPLLNFEGWNGIYSSTSYDFTNGHVQARVVQVAAGVNDFTMLAAGFDGNNYYRAWINNGTLAFHKTIGGTKQTLFSTPYNPTQHRFLKISHVGGNVVFSTAPSAGSWTNHASEAWNTSAVPIGTVRFELKAGAAGSDSGTRSAQFDDFLAATP
jgi:hypothetical protein